MELQTKRLILRPWQESDAEALYKYACNLCGANLTPCCHDSYATDCFACLLQNNSVCLRSR